MRGRGEPRVSSASRLWATLRAILPEMGLLPSKLLSINSSVQEVDGKYHYFKVGRNGGTSFCPLSSIFHTLYFAVLTLFPVTLVISLLSYCSVQLGGKGTLQE